MGRLYWKYDHHSFQFSVTALGDMDFSNYEKGREREREREWELCKFDLTSEWASEGHQGKSDINICGHISTALCLFPFIISFVTYRPKLPFTCQSTILKHPHYLLASERERREYIKFNQLVLFAIRICFFHCSFTKWAYFSLLKIIVFVWKIWYRVFLC